MELLTTNMDIHQLWSYKFRQKEINKPSEELMAKLLTDYPEIESWTSQQCIQAMKDYQDAQYQGDIPPVVVKSKIRR